jgi:hypothetical protein
LKTLSHGYFQQAKVCITGGAPIERLIGDARAKFPHTLHDCVVESISLRSATIATAVGEENFLVEWRCFSRNKKPHRVRNLRDEIC